jgi:hypothetical protein
MLGYKLRRHISKALQVRSATIRNALERYNDAAKRMSPPRRQLSWDEVVDYAFLAEFDLLRDSREDIRLRPWAQPANRILMDEYFKIERAREEIDRLNIEIRRIITHIEDEENFLLEAEEVAPSDEMRFFIRQYHLDRTRFSKLHLRRFSKLAQRPGFTGQLEAGEPIDRTLRGGQPAPTAAVATAGPHSEEKSPTPTPRTPAAHPSQPAGDPMDVDGPAITTRTDSSTTLNKSTPSLSGPLPPNNDHDMDSQDAPVRRPIIYGSDGLCSDDAEGETDDGGAGDMDAQGESDDDDVEYLEFAVTSMILALADR